MKWEALFSYSLDEETVLKKLSHLPKVGHLWINELDEIKVFEGYVQSIEKLNSDLPGISMFRFSHF